MAVSGNGSRDNPHYWQVVGRLPSAFTTRSDSKDSIVPVPKHHTMKTYRGSGDKAPYILNFSIR
jgi:hypothetical protein